MVKKRKSVINEFGIAGLGLGKASLGIGITAGVVEKAGGSAAPVQTVGSFLPIGGQVIGGGLVLSSLGGLQKSAKIIKRKRR